MYFSVKSKEAEVVHQNLQPYSILTFESKLSNHRDDSWAIQINPSPEIGLGEEQSLRATCQPPPLSLLLLTT